MDLIATAWNPSRFDGGRVLQIPANYGTEGSLHINDWTPVYVPPTGTDAHIQQWNMLTPIVWDLQVMTPQEAAVRGQASLTQVPAQSPATYVPPGTASLSFD